MTKIIFVNPPLSHKELYHTLAGGGSELPPLGLCNLAAVTRENGFETEILDAQALKMDYENTARVILEKNPDYVGVTATTIAIFNAGRLANLLKNRREDVRIIIGGAHLTAAPYETMERFPQFDVGVIGEGEVAILELLRNYEGLNHINGIVYRKNGQVKLTGNRKFIKDLDLLPMPAWDLLPDIIKYYQPAADSINRFPASSLVTSRGCPGRCTFCDRSVFGNFFRFYSAEYILRMIKELISRYGIKELYIHDDTFTVNRKRIMALCNLIREEDIDITWSCNGRADFVDLDMLKEMKKSGCWQISYGIESGSQETLNVLKKGITLEKIENAVRDTKKAGLRVKGLFMIGVPKETYKTMEETIKFLKRLDLDDFHMTCFTPFPGTEIYANGEKYGKIDRDWRKMNMFYPNFIPEGLTRRDIMRYYRYAYRAFYLRPKTILYYVKKLRSFAVFKKLFRGLIAFFKFQIKP